MDGAKWRLDGPVAGKPSVGLGRFDLAKHGYVVEEFFLSGTALSYKATAGDEVEPDASAEYRTRLLVCRPADTARFGGTVAVEWFNVSGGGDGAPDWMFLHRQIMRTGAAWVGVSAQKVGVEGGSRASGGMQQLDPQRYESLAHPGDSFAFDIYSHAAHAVRDDRRVLGGATPRTVISVGESQSAMYLVTYVNRIDPLVHVYDAFLVHGRGARGFGWPREDPPSASGRDVILSPRVPTITVQSETDVVAMQGWKARSDDSATSRLWEIAGAAHFDTWGLHVSQEDDGTLPIERLAELGGMEVGLGGASAEPPNSGPQQHYVLQAALAHLERWASGGAPAPHAPRLETATDGDRIDVSSDEHGIARGGVRTPWVDVPTAMLSGLGAKGEGFAGLFGVTRRFDQAKLAVLYPGGREDYLGQFAAASERARAAGFLLDDDIDEILGLARASWPGAG